MNRNNSGIEAADMCFWIIFAMCYYLTFKGKKDIQGCLTYKLSIVIFSELLSGHTITLYCKRLNNI